MNTLQKSILATSAALALATGAILTPLAAFGSSEARTEESAQTHQRPSDGPVVQRVDQDTSSSGVSCPGEQPPLRYGSDGLLTPESARQLLAAGCTTTDGSELEERAAPETLAVRPPGRLLAASSQRPRGAPHRVVGPPPGRSWQRRRPAPLPPCCALTSTSRTSASA